MKLQRFSPMLLAQDVPVARAFYERLGFQVNADLGWFVGLQQGEFELSLCDAAHEFVPVSAREPSAVILALGVDDVTALAQELESEGVAMLSAMEDEPWGQRHIFVQAPDGVALDLFELIPPDPTWMKAHGFA